MATRKRSKTTRGGSSGRANPRNDGRITEQQHEEAMRVLRAEYYQGVRGLVEDLQRAIKDGEINSQDVLEERLHQDIDGSHWVIYTHANKQVILVSDNSDAFVDDFGEEGLVRDGDINWAGLAFAAMDHDVRELMDAEGVSIVEEAPRRGMHEARGPRGLRRAR